MNLWWVSSWNSNVGVTLQHRARLSQTCKLGVECRQLVGEWQHITSTFSPIFSLCRFIDIFACKFSLKKHSWRPIALEFTDCNWRGDQAWWDKWKWETFLMIDLFANARPLATTSLRHPLLGCVPAHNDHLWLAGSQQRKTQKTDWSLLNGQNQ